MAENHTSLAWLQDWYRRQCNGVREHSYGVRIGTIDNPGWSIDIDLEDTSLLGRHMDPIEKDVSDSDWIYCTIKGNKFIGRADPGKLSDMIAVFRAWVESEGPPSTKRG